MDPAPSSASPFTGAMPVRSPVRALLARADALAARLYGARSNPLHHTGALAALLLGILLVTGIYLLLFYRLGTPYASVARIDDQVWLGRWIRGLHRYASDLAVVAVGLHALRMFLQRRTWGPRALAWISGLVLLGLLFVCGWTGYVMVWDVQAQVLAVEGARFMDALPIFSEPIGRTFVGERPLPSAFFFINLFLHIALPVGLGLLLWIHVSRVARPMLLPPRRVAWGVAGLLLALALLRPAALGPEADLFALPGPAPFDAFFAFWLPLTRPLAAWMVWAGGGLLALAALAVPRWTRPATGGRPLPSVVDEQRCTGCEQCYHDCPYEAISMVERRDGRPGLVARVDPSLCVSCGICAGSCAPMVVGPPGRNGRAQLEAVRALAAARRPGPRDVVVIACERGAGGVARNPVAAGAGTIVLPVTCAGSVHTSVIEHLLRAGAGGVLVAACPARDCWNREGARWVTERMFHDREAELRARVDRRRVRLVPAGEGEPGPVLAELAAFRRAVATFDAPAVRGEGEPGICERAEAVS